MYGPFEAIEEGDAIYRLDDAAAPEDEMWEFPPGSVVRCATRSLSHGPALVAVELIDNG